MKIVADTYKWIETFICSRKGKKARNVIAIAKEVYTPDIVLAEIARKYIREGADRHVMINRLRTIAETSDISSINGRSP